MSEEYSTTKDPKSFIESYLNLTITKTTYKYPSLQEKKVICGKLDDDLLNMCIEILEKTGWKVSNIVTFIFRQYYFLQESGILSMFTDIYNKGLLNSEEGQKEVINKLREVIPEYIRVTTESMIKFRK
jgi:hypothetical protein